MMGKPSITSLLLLGAAAFGAYKYSKLTDEQKQGLKDKGKKFFDDNLGSLKNIFGGSEGSQTAGANGGQNGPAQG
jgi:hypothetical protein